MSTTKRTGTTHPKLDFEAKLHKYINGKYLVPVPDVTHNQWTSLDWINYIDQRGRWL